MKHKRTVIIALMSLSMIPCCLSCSHRQYPESSTDTSTTTVIRETVHDTVITVQPDTSIIQALVRCNADGSVYLQQIEQLKSSNGIRQTLELKDNHITATATIDSMSIYLTYKERYHETTTNTNTVQVVKETTNILQPWQRIFISVGFLTILAMCIWLFVQCMSVKS